VPSGRNGGKRKGKIQSLEGRSQLKLNETAGVRKLRSVKKESQDSVQSQRESRCGGNSEENRLVEVKAAKDGIVAQELGGASEFEV
jgi:hypothetical protein